MTEWLLSLQGTEAGSRLAMVLAVMAAVLHAVFGAIQKGRHDPWLTRGAVDVAYATMALPIALFVVPFPEPHMWPIFITAMLIHLAYKLLQVMSYSRGAYTVVYPVMRGTGPLVTVIAAGIVFSETYAPLQWFGIGGLSLGIVALAGINLASAEKVDRGTLGTGLFLAFLTGIFVAFYTTYDAYGIRAAANPFTFLFWFFVFDGLIFPWLTLWHYKRLEEKPTLGPLALRGIIGGLVAFSSFGSILFATWLDKVGKAAVLRETSTIFAALIGWLFLKEKVGLLRATLMAVIAAGAVLVEIGG